MVIDVVKILFSESFSENQKTAVKHTHADDCIIRKHSEFVEWSYFIVAALVNVMLWQRLVKAAPNSEPKGVFYHLCISMVQTFNSICAVKYQMYKTVKDDSTFFT